MTSIREAAVDDITAVAAGEARSAAERAGVAIRDMTTPDDHTAVARLLTHVWGLTDDRPKIPHELLCALGKAGNYISGAYADGELIGASVAFYTDHARAALHSHITGISPLYAGRSVGYAMKLHQRAWCLARGIDVIQWTFDPLIARNAHFNLVKLRATAVEYLPDFYGSVADAVNAGDLSDRLFVRWDLRDPAVVAAAAGRRIEREGDVSVPVPADIERLRVSDPTLARSWRLGVRAQLSALLGGGAQIVDFHRTDGYVVHKRKATP